MERYNFSEIEEMWKLIKEKNKVQSESIIQSQVYLCKSIFL